MTTEVIRDRNSLAIQWVVANEDRWWTVSKKFDLGTRILEPASVELSGLTRWDTASDARQVEAELHFSIWLAAEMDLYFTRPEDFDRVRIDDTPPLGSYPATIYPHSDGKIYIAKGNK